MLTRLHQAPRAAYMKDYLAFQSNGWFTAPPRREVTCRSNFCVFACLPRLYFPETRRKGRGVGQGGRNRSANYIFFLFTPSDRTLGLGRINAGAGS